MLQLRRVARKPANRVSPEDRDLPKACELLALEHPEHISKGYLPSIKLIYVTFLRAVQHPEQVNEDRLPDAELKFVQEVNYKHQKEIETCMAEPLRKCVLGQHTLVL